MPQRTNDYQQLVYLIQMALAPVGAKVTESAMIPGQDTLREIDVLIETDVGPYSIKIAVETKDFKRPLNVTEIEAVIGKYAGNGGIAVNKVVVVARRGFSDAAIKRAKEARIELLTVREAKQSDWSRLAPKNLCFHVQPHIERVEIVPNVKATPAGPARPRAHRVQVSRPQQRNTFTMGELVPENAGLAEYRGSAAFR